MRTPWGYEVSDTIDPIISLTEFHQMTGNAYVSNPRVGAALIAASQAIRNYCAEIDGEKSLDVLCDRIYKIVSAEVDSQTSRMVHMLFKIAVEMAIQNHMLAAGYVDLTDREMKNIRYKCQDEVRKSHGFILFEKALAAEKSAGE